MSLVTRCGTVSLLLGLLVGTAPVAAQTTSGSSWTDPPVRASVGPAESKPDVKPPATAEAPAPADTTKPAEGATPKQSAEAPPVTTPAQRAASALGVKQVAANQQTASTHSAAQARRFVARPRMVERPITLFRRPARIAERPSHRVSRHVSRRTIRSYAFVPERRATGQVDPYDGRADANPWPRRRAAGWGELVGDNRANRIARARESGYSVMRVQTYEYPDGTRARTVVPFDGGGFGDTD